MTDGSAHKPTGMGLIKAATLMGTTILATGALSPSQAFADPSSLTFTSGSGTVSVTNPSGGPIDQLVTITTVTNRSVIEGNIDIDAREHWHVDQQAGAASRTLLRDITSDPSMIFGMLTSNGEIFLINPNGIVFGGGAVVDAASFVATTANITDQDFIADRLQFLEAGIVDAAIVNHGRINARDGGLVALVAPTVRNDGVIQAKLGKVVLGAGDAFTIETVDLYGDGLISFAAPKSLDGSPRLFTATNTGAIVADGGRIVMTASAAGAVVDSAINTTGLLQANTIAESNGVIELLGGDGTTTEIGGTIVATAAGTGTGGRITITGETVAVRDGARIDASGADGGGRILIGGDYQGGGSTYRSKTTTVAGSTTLASDATNTGDGGTIVVWSDRETVFEGQASARGGATAGDGGLVEVSSKTDLTFNGNVDTRAANGKTGTLLLDPTDMTISAAANSANNVNVGTLQTQLATTNVTVTTAAPGPDAGDIGVNAAVTWGAATTLTLQADNNVNINQNVTANGGGSVIVQARNSITLANNRSITATGGGSITATADSDNSGAGDFVAAGANATLRNAGGAISVTGRNVTTGLVNASFGSGINNGGNVTLTATGGSVSLLREILSEANAVAGTQSGSVTISATGDVAAVGGNGNRGIIRTRNIGGGGGATGRTAGAISVTAGGNVTLRAIDSSAQRNNATGGNISISAGGAVDLQQNVVAHAFNAVNGTGGTLTVTGGGNVTLRGQTRTDATGGNNGTGGAVSVTSTGGNILFTRNAASDVLTRADRNGIGGALSLSAANGTISLGTANNFFADTRGSTANGTTGTGGAITMTARAIDVRRDLVADGGQDGGTAGAVTLNATNGALQTRTILARGGSRFQNNGTGTGGAVTLSGTTVTQQSGESIDTRSNRRDGNGGAVTVNSTGAATLGNIITQSGQVSGNGAFIDINAGGSVATGTLTSQGIGAGATAGAITIDTTSGNITTLAIDSDADGANGTAGLVRLQANTGNVTVTGNVDATANANNGQAGNITLTAGGSITNNAQILSRTNGANGRGGDVAITAGTSISLLDVITEGNNATAARAGSATLSAGTTLAVRTVTSRSTGTAAAGAISATAGGNLTFTGNLDATGRADGGNVTLSSTTGNVTGNNRFILTRSQTGNGGNVSITANAGQINLGTGNNAAIDTRGATNAGQIGNAGSITLVGNTLNVQRDFDARGGAAGGNGGTVSLTANTGNLFVRTVTTQGQGAAANGGAISLTAPNEVRVLANESISANGGAGTGTGGNIAISATTTRLTGTNVTQVTSTGGSSGGSITISNALQIDASKQITTGATGGNISIGGGIETSGGNNRDLTLNAGTGTLSVGGDIGATAGRRTRTTVLTGSTVSINSITTQNAGAITLNGPVRLLGNTTLDANGNGNITVNGTIDGTGAGGQTLTFQPNNTDTILTGAIGSATRVGAVTFSGNNTRTVGLVDIFTDGGAVTVGQNARLNANTTIDTQGGAVTFDRDLNAAAAGVQTLSIDTNGGDVAFNRALGTQRLGTLTVADAGNVTFNTTGAIQTRGVTVSNATGAVSATQVIDTDGGAVAIQGASVALVGVDTRNPTAGGNAGNVTLTATAAPLAVNFAIDARGTNNGAGAGGAGGSVTLSGTSVTLDTAPLVGGGNAGGGAFDGGSSGRITVSGTTIDLNVDLTANGGTGSGAGVQGDGGGLALNGRLRIAANRALTTVGDRGGDVALTGGIEGTVPGTQLVLTTGLATGSAKGAVNFGSAGGAPANAVDVTVNQARNATGSVNVQSLTLNDTDASNLFGRINGIGGSGAAGQVTVAPILAANRFFVNNCDVATGVCIQPVSATATVDVFKVATERSIDRIDREISLEEFKSGESRPPAIVAFCSTLSAGQCVDNLNTLADAGQVRPGRGGNGRRFEDVIYYDAEKPTIGANLAYADFLFQTD